MQSFYCDTLELRIHFEPHEIKADQLLKALAERGLTTEPDEDGDVQVAFTCAPSQKTEGLHHAHLNIVLTKNGEGRVVLSYHSGRLHSKTVAAPNTDDCAQWLGSFFKDTVTAHTHVNYTFDDTFTSAVSLDFPLTAPAKELAGAMVSGLAIVLPKNPKMAIIQSGQNEIYIFIRGTAELDPKSFDLFVELNTLTPLVESLVTKVDQSG